MITTKRALRILKERNEFRALCLEMLLLLTDYRTQPNCGEYGVTKGWADRVDALTKRVNRMAP